jgi:hypothetical protein
MNESFKELVGAGKESPARGTLSLPGSPGTHMRRTCTECGNIRLH